MSQVSENTLRKPEILAPVGDSQCFLAALAAGADALYLGLKNFSARMEAENFGLTELSGLCDLAHDEGARVYITMNTLIKQEECHQCFRLIKRLEDQVHCDGLIIQDPAVLTIAKAAGFSGGLFLSTLANVTHPETLRLLPALGVSRVILPRELSLDEVRLMAERCPDNLDLELFVHGALCFCVSGRCYWSSYLGGKSGLRGRCVQPCRRAYQIGQSSHPKRISKKGKASQFFSCQDLSLACISKTLLSIPHLASWKIEGRKKGPHYVYHCVAAYKLLRDHAVDPAAQKEAQELLTMALGRPGTQARFLPKRQRIPTNPGGYTGSGLLLGKIQRSGEKLLLRPATDLKAKDFLRIGSEDQRWHETLRLPRNGAADAVTILPFRGKKLPPEGTPVYLIDRREPRLVQALARYEEKRRNYPGRKTSPCDLRLELPAPQKSRRRPDMHVLATIPRGKDNRAGSRNMLALWLTPKTAEISRTVARRVFWWLPPVVWPDESAKLGRIIQHLWRDGSRHFVANAPWQRAFFPEILPAGADLVAGPFCNIANVFTLQFLARMGFKAAFISPELGKKDLLALPRLSPLPLGLVLEGFWPVGISRFGLLGLKQNVPFSSPKGEMFWARNYGQNTWIYPAWPLNLKEKESELLSAGYSFFATLSENDPPIEGAAARPGLFNWEQPLL
ncbi:MAG: U32 family peptidase [Desulfovibrio sp.]|nr:U32 family peptidase [Desulfovibrio sp.]